MYMDNVYYVCEQYISMRCIYAVLRSYANNNYISFIFIPNNDVTFKRYASATDVDI